MGECIKAILSKGDFNLTKRISNSAQVRKAFNGEMTDEELDVSGRGKGMKVLGVIWKKGEDVFTFQDNNTEEVICEGSKSMTRLRL